MSANSSAESRLEFIQRITAYGPVVATTVVLLVQTFIPSALTALPLSATLAILAASVVFLVWHVETTLITSTRSIDTLGVRVERLESMQRAFITSSTCLSHIRLGSAFAIIAGSTPRIGHLRIYAISSQQILSFLKFNDIIVDKCQILLRAFDENDRPHQDFLNQIKLVVADWHHLQKSGRIGKLEIRHYDFFPTEYECIFDKDHLIIGLYDSDPEDYSEVRVRDPILVRGSSDAGRIMISEFADRFDGLFEVCATHHGSHTIEPAAKN
jgi:hypothetical protein